MFNNDITVALNMLLILYYFCLLMNVWKTDTVSGLQCFLIQLEKTMEPQ